MKVAGSSVAVTCNGGQVRAQGIAPTPPIACATVTAININGDAGGNFAFDEQLHLTERFRLLDADTLLYQFEIDDPTAYTAPWKGELTMARTNERIYEYACHEANYSLENMLRGFRAAEKKKDGGR